MSETIDPEIAADVGKQPPDVSLADTPRRWGTLLSAAADLCSFYRLGTMEEVQAVRALIAEFEALPSSDDEANVNRIESLLGEAHDLAVDMLTKRRDYEESARAKSEQGVRERNARRPLYPKKGRRRR